MDDDGNPIDDYADDYEPDNSYEADNVDTDEEELGAEEQEGEEEEQQGEEEDKQPDSADLWQPPTQSTDGNYSNMDSADLFETRGQNATEQNTTALKAMTAAVSRCMTASRSFALEFNAGLEDIGQLKYIYQLCPSKLYRQRGIQGRERISVRNQFVLETGIQALYFDERKDLTTVLEKVKTMVTAEGDTFIGENIVSMTKREEHCPIIMHNSEKMEKDLYIGTLDPPKGTGACLGDLIYNLLEEFDSLQKLKILASDSTKKNSGPYSGTAAHLEEKTGQALQRIYCILHTIDLIGKHFFTMIDGGSSGPESRKGPLGKKLTREKMHLKPIVDFKPIPTKVPDLPAEVVKNLSNDYKYLYKFSKAISIGSSYFTDPKCKAMITASPGKYHQARWLPIFNRTQRVYVQTPR